MQIEISPEAAAIIERLISTGIYRDAADVVQEALLHFGAAGSIEDDEPWLRQAIAEGEASGEPISVDPENLKDHIINGAPLIPR